MVFMRWDLHHDCRTYAVRMHGNRLKMEAIEAVDAFRSTAGRYCRWKHGDVVSIAAAIHGWIPKRALRALRRVRMSGPLIVFSKGDMGTQTCIRDLEKNAMWILPILKHGPVSGLPRSNYFFADVLMELDRRLQHALLETPSKALKEAIRYRRLLSYLRRLRRNGSRSKGSALVEAMKRLLDDHKADICEMRSEDSQQSGRTANAVQDIGKGAGVEEDGGESVRMKRSGREEKTAEWMGVPQRKYLFCTLALVAWL